jgi:hypothetical protein
MVNFVHAVVLHFLLLLLWHRHNELSFKHEKQELHNIQHTSLFFPDVPEIQSVSINGHTGNPFMEGTPITVTARVRSYPVANITWGIDIKNSRFNKQFMPLG